MSFSSVPLATALKNEIVWMIEYDIDFSGDWRDFFRQFETNKSDRHDRNQRVRGSSSSRMGSDRKFNKTAAGIPHPSSSLCSIRSCGCHGVF